MLSGSDLAWVNSSYLTLSFAPDGTDVAGQESRMFDQFGTLGEPASWQNAVLQAFQTWAQHANADVGVVGDGGQPFGSNGAVQRDARFGDIRVASVSLEQDVFALSVVQDVVSGTWVGDLLFNSDVSISSLDELFRLSLHEAGNIFGLADNNDPTSPMNSAGTIPSARVPTANDIAALEQRHGERVPDANEQQKPNDLPNDATHLRDSPEDGYLPSSPRVVYGDITDLGDVDYFRFDVADGYTGPATFRLRSSGISLLTPRITLFDRDGVEFDSLVSASLEGDELRLTIPNVESDGRYLVRVDSPRSDEFAVGGYALAVTMDDLFVGDELLLRDVMDGRYRRLAQDEILDVWSAAENGSDALINDDAHGNDSIELATELESEPGFAENVRYSTVAHLARSDIDFYQVRSPRDPNLPGIMTVSVRGFDGGPFNGDVSLRDNSGAPLEAAVVTQNDTETILQVVGVPENQDFFVQLTAAGAVATNYSLVVAFHHRQVPLTPLSAVSLTAASSRVEQPYVAETRQLIQIVAEANSDQAVNGTVHLSLQTVRGETVRGFAVPVGETRSLDSFFLARGSYSLVVDSVDTLHGPVSVSIYAIVVTDPLAIPPSDPTFDPLVDCPGHILCSTGSPDVNQDSVVDASDAEVLFSLWGTDTDFADFNGDGVVDAADAGWLFAAWTGDGWRNL